MSRRGPTALAWTRLRRSLRAPTARDGFETVLALAAFGVLLAYPAQRSGLVDLGALSGSLGDPPAAWSPWMPLRVLLAPALVEEVPFRVLANPHPAEKASRRRVAISAALSLSVYVAVHPLAALLRPGAREVLLDPVFLAATAALGALCWVLYRRSGSLLPPVLLHAAVVTAWLALGGAAALGRGSA